MAQKKDLNISPYYDDFESDNNFYKVLFKPGFPVQARELTNLQSILQNQIEDFGSHMFKEGSIVIPGAPTYDDEFDAVKLNATQFGVDISLYTDQLIGKVVEGSVTGVKAVVDFVALPDSNNVQDLTIYVKYNTGTLDRTAFVDGESLIVKENIVYGSTTINAGTAVATLLSTDATATGSAASVADGVYFIRGTFVNVSKQTIVLDYYSNTPSYRVGLQIDEQIITAKDDPSLYDNAKGFTNYAAPGADRLKISLTLVKKEISDKNDTDFVEILRVQEGRIRKITTKTDYNIIKDYLAERTFEESGNYSLQPFNIIANNSLNDRMGNGGLFFGDQNTDEGNTPSDDLMCYSVSGGEAYVKGYDVVTDSVTILDANKTRDVEKIDAANVPFTMGSLLVCNNLKGQPQYRKVIDLYDQLNSTGTVIGKARVYSVTPKDNTYSGASSNWNVRLYDIQTYTKLTLNLDVSNTQIKETYFIKGKNSGATGYATAAGGGLTTVYVRQTSGTFMVGEQILINGVDTLPRSITAIEAYTGSDIKSVKQTATSPYVQNFTADARLNTVDLPNGITAVQVSSGTMTFVGGVISGIKANDIIKVKPTASADGSSDLFFVRVTEVAADALTATVADIGQSVAGVYKGTGAGSLGACNAWLGRSRVDDIEGGLYERLPDSNISSVDLSSSVLRLSAQVTGIDAVGSASTISFSDVKDGSGSGISTAFFEAYNLNRYAYHYGSNTGVGTITSDSFKLLGDGSKVQFTGLNATDTDGVIGITAKKQGIQSKIKNYIRSQILTVDKSSLEGSGSTAGSTRNDGLTYNGEAYGLRVQDDSISLNVPDVSKVLAVYESLDTSAPTLDTITLTATASVGTNVIIGENVVGKTSNTIARVVTNNGSTPSSGGANRLGVVYLNEKRFSKYEDVVFQESNITTTLQAINEGTTDGQYQNITNSFTLDKGQRQQYYDFSRLNRNRTASVPSKQLLVVYDFYSVPSNDTGDAFTVLSYDKNRYSKDIPLINGSVRATDTLDFRPRVSEFVGVTTSPFDFNTRSLAFNETPKFILAANESTLLGYEYYLGRIDKIYLSEYGVLTVQKGKPARNPQPPTLITDSMELATLTIPAYLYNPASIRVNLTDNRRYTMRDIGKLEDRIEELEEVTTLSLLEVSTEALSIQDAAGRDRFKSGFFVDNFKTPNFVNLSVSSITIDTNEQEIRPLITRNTLDSALMPQTSTSDANADYGTNFTLLDANVQKTGDIVTLAYDEELWIEQVLATKMENVNPFNVTTFHGNLTLQPDRDTWVRTVRLDNIESVENVEEQIITGRGWNVVIRDGQTISNVQGSGWNTQTFTNEEERRTVVEELEEESRDVYMRSRNTHFNAKRLRPFTPHYQFLDGISGVDFIPKLLEISNDSTLTNYGSSGTFRVGETVKGFAETSAGSSSEIITFRVAQSNHQEGAYNSPSAVYGPNPYSPSETIQAEYTNSSKIINVDCVALAAEAQGLYYGYVTVGTKLVGQTSGAIAYVKDLRLVSDTYGELQGTFFLKDPNTTPPPSVVVRTGRKTFRITDSFTNVRGPGLRLSDAQAEYESVGTYRTLQQLTRDITTRRNIEVRTKRHLDPLAQSFTVGGNVENIPDVIGFDEDQYGVTITAVDIYFATKPEQTDNPLTVEIRTVELGTPTLDVIGKPVTLTPSQITTSTDGTVATKVTFSEPIYLPPGREYAIVLLAPTTNEYNVWIARMGETAVNTQDLPNASAQIYSQQWALGSLFKSQNGSIWSADQYEDLKFKLYKARFTANNGTVFFSNPTLNASNGYVETLQSNPIITLPKTGRIGITTIKSGNAGITTLSAGRTIVGSTYNFSRAVIVGVGNSVKGAKITSGGSNYTSTNDVQTFNIIGDGTDLKLNITATDGVITGITTAQLGNGYKIGDVVGIVTSQVGDKGINAEITITDIGGGIDTLYLDQIQGTANTGSFNKDGVVRYLDGTSIYPVGVGTNYRENLVVSAAPNDGQHFKVTEFNHGMNSDSNKVRLNNIKSNTTGSSLTLDLVSTETSTISVASTSPFGTFEGINIGVANPGYVKIDDEIISYTDIAPGQLKSLTRGIDDTQVLTHNTTVPNGTTGGKSTTVEKYELSGVSLRRINSLATRKHTISDVSSGLGTESITADSYYVKIDNSANGVNRSSDSAASPQLSFANNAFAGGEEVKATKNIQFDAIIPVYDVFTPSTVTFASGAVRTVSGTSIDGSEVPFIDQGFESIQLNTLNEFTTPRLVASEVNETQYLGSIERNKSFTTAITFTTNSTNVSPILDTNVSFTEFRSNLVNSPIEDYITDGRTASLNDDPHAAVYVSNTIGLEKPADSLKVIFAANRPAAADFRVLYSLVRPDSNGTNQEFVLFPGYDNLTDSTGDGFGDLVKDPARNDGKADAFVPASKDGEYLEYEYTANDVGEFVGYTIKIVMSSTNQATPPRIKEFRTIALK